MCGIFGVFNIKKPIGVSRVLAARDFLTHRGPDDAGLYLSSTNASIQPNVALAHRRLSIIDLSSAAHQPMVTEDGRYTIVYNGEIYNYKGLIPSPSPKEKGVLKSKSDTEVILYLFSKYGKDCLQFLRGMFAFAIWDDREKTLFAARDRFGIKPFYYLYNANPPDGEAGLSTGKVEFIFSSELKAIKHYKGNLTINDDALDAFLRTGSVPAPLTIYKEVAALLPGYWLEWKMSEVKCQKYWEFREMVVDGKWLMDDGKKVLDSRLRENDRHKGINEQDKNTNRHTDPSNHASMHPYFHALRYDDNAKQKIRSALLDTIKAHMVSDVEVGAFLSGGIDSTAIVSLMRQCGKEKIKTLSIVFPDSRFDESKYSRLAAKKYNTEHIEIPFYEKDLIDDFENIMAVMDQPTIDGINTYFVSKAAKQAGLKVVLSGLGADELFGGYPSFNLIPKYQRIKNLPFAKMFMKFAAPLLKNKFPAKAIHDMKNPDEPNAEYKLIRGLFTDDELKSLGCKVGSQRSEVNSQWQSPKQQLTNLPMTNDQMLNDPMTNDQLTNDKFTNLQYVSMMESCYYMRNQLLRDSDVFSMAHSVELRVPFVDHRLYETVLPYLDDAYDKNFPKRMLVEAVGDIPDEIVHRPKMGFTFPFEDWIRNGQLKDLMTEALNDLDAKLKINHTAMNINEAHWSRAWAFYTLTNFTN
jgi:asparagine synthase (glutamine-hydrolysing)